MPIIIKDVSFTYMKKTPYEKKALDKINLEIKDNEIQGIIGHTGSGKSTLIQHINGLIKLQEGVITVGDIVLTDKKRPKPDFTRLRSEVGMVFQYPEYQLFEETVFKDVAFGPKNLKVPSEEIEGRVKEAIEIVGLNFDEVKNRSPFDLSGGQKRRVAIAGVLAMKPKILILDEPTAGLDPSGRREMYDVIGRIKEDCTPTIVIISHNMDEIANYSDRIAVLDKGRLVYNLPPRELFRHKNELYAMGLELPMVVRIENYLKERNFKIEAEAVNQEELVKELTEYRLRKNGGNSNA